MLLTPVEFAGLAVGIPWRRWCSSWRAVDCFGLLVLYHREVLGIELGAVPQTDIGAGFHAAKGWRECEPEPGATAWMAWRDGAPMHCGILLTAEKVLHCEGSNQVRGSVRVSHLDAVSKMFGDLKFYRFEPACC